MGTSAVCIVDAEVARIGYMDEIISPPPFLYPSPANPMLFVRREHRGQL